MKYRVDISPDAKREFVSYLDGAEEFGVQTVTELLDSFDRCIEALEKMPYAGFEKLKYIPAKYKVMHMWKHYWMIFQIYEEEKAVKIEYIIDDRQNYGTFFH
ncbi:MAG: type II toxin-antitoxin system RelE/ParE family toxin [Lachnospiraceae bacterium]